MMLAERTEEPMKSSSDIYRKALLYIDPRDAKLVELVSSSAKRKEIERCLDTGADPNVFNGGQCAIHAAVCKGDASICSLLIERGSELNLADSDGQRPLHLAAQKSFTSCVHVLLMHGARTDSRNFNGDTPLHCASRSNSLGVTKLLLSSKADVQVLNLDGNTPVHLAARAGAAEVLSELLKNVMESNGGEAVRSLINFRNLAGDTALQMAVNSNTSLEGRREAVTLLMEYGALSTDENNTLLPELERFLSKAESASNVPKEDSNREKLFYSSRLFSRSESKGFGNHINNHSHGNPGFVCSGSISKALSRSPSQTSQVPATATAQNHHAQSTRSKISFLSRSTTNGKSVSATNGFSRSCSESSHNFPLEMSRTLSQKQSSSNSKEHSVKQMPRLIPRSPRRFKSLQRFRESAE